MKRVITSLLLVAQVGLTYAEVVSNSSVITSRNDSVEVTIERLPTGFELVLVKDNEVYKEQFAEEGLEIKGVILTPQADLLEVLVFDPDYNDVYYSFDL